MTTIVFDNEDIRIQVPGIQIIGLSPAIPGKKRNKVEIPGKDYDYDFGNNYKTNFNITVDFKIIATYITNEETGEEVLEYSVLDGFNQLSTFLDHDEAKDFVIDEFTGKAQVYDSVETDYNQIKNVLSGSITFECWKEEEEVVE